MYGILYSNVEIIIKCTVCFVVMFKLTLIYYIWVPIYISSIISTIGVLQFSINTYLLEFFCTRKLHNFRIINFFFNSFYLILK